LTAIIKSFIESFHANVRGFRRAMANAMTAAVKVPHFHYMEEMDVDALVELKNTLSTSIPLPPGVKLTYLPFLIKSLSAALLKHPIMNSTVNEDVTEIQVKGELLPLP
jgi:2-oxoisovalerate dehydrogenase E2 component (dihydrolipoyl transacylase)